MAVTSAALFGNAAQSGTWTIWDTLPNVLIEDDTSARMVTAEASTELSNELILTNPLAESEIPAGSVIEAFALGFRYNVAAMTGDWNITSLRIANQTINTSPPLLQGSFEMFWFSGDLAFWGITQQEALDFLNGLEDARFQLRKDSTSVGINGDVAWVSCQVTYDPPPGTLVAPPVLF